MTTDNEIDEIGRALGGVMQAVGRIEAAARSIKLRIYEPERRAEDLQQHLADAITRIASLEGTVDMLRERFRQLAVDVDAIGQVPRQREVQQ